MLDVKKLLAKILQCLHEPLVIGSVTKSVSLSAGGYGSFTVDTTKSGYTPLGVVGIAPTGGASGYARLSQFELLNDNAIHFFVWNMYNSSVTWTIWFKVLYLKNWGGVIESIKRFFTSLSSPQDWGWAMC